MKEHIWIMVEINGGSIGSDDFWVCKKCDAAGGPVFPEVSIPKYPPFYPDGSGLKVSDNCDEALEQIRDHLMIKARKDIKPKQMR